MHNKEVTVSTTPSKLRLFSQGVLAMMPLSLAVVPWGFLAGSFAIESGLTPLEGQAMSAVLFAGAAQLVAMGMIKSGATIMTMVITIFFITSRHFLYSLSMREHISSLPLRWRLGLGFLLTDELFALCGHKTPQQFDRWFAFGAGISFYVIWNVATLVGLIIGAQIPDLQQYGLEFAVAATFIAIVVPNIQSIPTLLAVVSALMTSVVLAVMNVELGLVIASVVGMSVGYFSEGRLGNRKYRS
ncbi:branched-chain amino acid ABC transporter permease [Vibrio sp. 10N.286.49.C2]|uniref:AzlC family ABC transporter permease n=1 Tax=unclassified Vibrio TaxID=2614977 RepID=UPI000CBCA4A9|nr:MULTISPECIES: AzlC family ABC transporter permease [unclassified Vibrio]PMH34798.1 branched-chain amino acid ABC transporter permease [Vibrio sp. 10N.286.49.C2]PMH51414.1 branched-chain amino acid ABC transporter permease [Vibrio sp. 10N.286.49.B1]PMH81821.1 branched-chain amino acid ABC transporter permease [Vibrio sp. 10N.286.48.B7]